MNKLRTKIVKKLLEAVERQDEIEGYILAKVPGLDAPSYVIRGAYSDWNFLTAIWHMFAEEFDDKNQWQVTDMTMNLYDLMREAEYLTPHDIETYVLLGDRYGSLDGLELDKLEVMAMNRFIALFIWDWCGDEYIRIS